MCGAVAVFAATAAVGAVSAFSQQKAANEAAQYNAAVAERNAQIADAQAAQATKLGDLEEKRLRARVSTLKGKQRSTFAGSGVLVDAGSPQDVIEDTVTQGELDALTVRYNAQQEAYGHRLTASNLRSQGQLSLSTQRSPIFAATNSLLGSAGQVASIYARRRG